MQTRQPADLLIEARWVLPIAPDEAVLSEHAVAVTDGRIVALGPSAALAARYEPRERIVRSAHALLPGLVNAHTRTSNVLRRSRAACTDAAPLAPELARAGAQLAMAQMLRAGITCFGDDAAYPQETARVAAAARVRVAVGLPVADTRTVWARSATAHLAQAEELWDAYRADPWICLYFAPASEAVSDATLARVRTIADELDARIAMCVPPHSGARTGADTQGEARALRRLNELGLLRPGFAAIGMTRIEHFELELAARTGIAVIACPQASARESEGACPFFALAGRGVTVGLGSGTAADGTAFDLLAEARAAALLAGSAGDRGEALPAPGALRLATLGGARALGLGSLIGSIEPGKAADLIAVDLGALSAQTLATVPESLVFAATREHVSDVWVGGRAVVTHGRLIAFDEQELTREHRPPPSLERTPQLGAQR